MSIFRNSSDAKIERLIYLILTLWAIGVLSVAGFVVWVVYVIFKHVGMI